MAANWRVVYTQPNKEGMVNDFLRAQGLETFYPCVKPAYPRRDRRAWLPLFPRYLFVKVDFSLLPRSKLEWMPGVVHVVSFGGEPAWVPDHVIEYMRRRVEWMNVCGIDAFQPGERVRIKEGPMQDLEAIFQETISPAGRVRILLNVLGRLTPCEIDARSLERLSA